MNITPWSGVLFTFRPDRNKLYGLLKARPYRHIISTTDYYIVTTLFPTKALGSYYSRCLNLVNNIPDYEIKFSIYPPCDDELNRNIYQ
jgi:hypothetical protein